MQLGRTIRLWPTRQQAAQFSRYAGAARFAWNESLAYCKRQQALTGRLPSELECRHHLADLRETTHPWLRDIPEAITKRAVKDLRSAYVKAFRNAKAGHMVGKSGNPYGFPRFRKRGKGTEGFYQRTDAFHMTDRRHVKITGIRRPVRIKYGCIPTHVVNTRVTCKYGRWYLSYSYEAQPVPSGTPNQGTIGIDLGLKSMAVCSNGLVARNPNDDRRARRLQRRITVLQRRLSRKYEANRKGTKYAKTRNIVRLEAKLARLHKQLADYRNNARHTFTHAIASTRPKAVVVEDLNVRGMLSNRKIARAAGRIGFYEIRRQLAYKAERYGYCLVEADRYYPSTQICSACKAKTGPKGFDGLAVRQWTCPDCGTVHDRDLNAALNLASLA